MPHQTTKSYSRKEVLALARHLHRRFGQRLTFKLFRAATGLSAEVIDGMFGNWRNLRRAIAIDPPDHASRQTRSNRQIIKALERIGREQQGEITQQEFCHMAGLTLPEIRSRFGSWRSKQSRVYTNRELLDPLLKYYLRHAEVPSKWMVEHHGGRSLIVKLRNRFGSWRKVELTLKAYIEIYFITRDPTWRKDEHTFVPDPQAEVDWPTHTACADWSPHTGWTHPDNL